MLPAGSILVSNKINDAMIRQINILTILTMFCAVLAMPAYGQWFSWESRSGLSYDQVVTLGNEMAQRGYAPTRIESSVENGELKFASIWIKEKELSKERWQFGVKLDEEAFLDQVNRMKSQGFAPIDVSVSPENGQPIFSGIWASGAMANWQSRHGLTKADVISRTKDNAQKGLELVDINAYPTAGGIRYAAIWGDPGLGQQINLVGVSESEFRKELANLPAGFVPYNINVSGLLGQMYYSVIFVKDDSFVYDIRYGMDEPNLQAYFNRQVDAGFAPHGITAYNQAGAPRYAAIFAKKKQERPLQSPVYALPDVSLPAASGRTLAIEPVLQQTKVWCWLAVGEMVFRHYGIKNANPGGNFQCGIIGTLMSDTECSTGCFNARCIRPSGSNLATVRMLKDYAWLASRRVLTADEGYELPFAAIKANIDDGRPIIAGISPIRRQYYDGAEHVALIVGYETKGSGVNVIVNDPFPYPPMGNPYTRNGAVALSDFRYRMPLRNFTQNLFWHWSIHNITIQ